MVDGQSNPNYRLNMCLMAASRLLRSFTLLKRPLVIAGWVAATNVITQNGTNNEVILNPFDKQAFFRLWHQ